jgi:hypothetical protein
MHFPKKKAVSFRFDLYWVFRYFASSSHRIKKVSFFKTILNYETWDNSISTTLLCWKAIAISKCFSYLLPNLFLISN